VRRVVQNMTLERELALQQKCGDAVTGHGPRVLSGYQMEVTTLKVGTGQALCGNSENLNAHLNTFYFSRQVKNDILLQLRYFKILVTVA